jgi:hypothetical protein
MQADNRGSFIPELPQGVGNKVKAGTSPNGAKETYLNPPNAPSIKRFSPVFIAKLLDAASSLSYASTAVGIPPFLGLTPVGYSRLATSNQPEDPP